MRSIRASAFLRSALPVLLVAAALGACELPRAHGDANAIIVASSAGLWDEIEPVVEGSLAPTVQTVRNERTFRVTWQDPEDLGDWGNLRRFRQVLVIGHPGEDWVSEALERRDRDEPLSPPEIVQVDDVWARGQQVSILVLPEEGQPDAVRALAGPLNELLDTQYRAFARSRMFASGRNEDLADSLRTALGFSLEFPRVYRYTVRDSVFRFRNDNPSPRELIREITVTWETPIPDDMPDQDELLAWRTGLADTYYADGQLLDTTIVSFRPVELDGLSAVELQSAWVSAPDAWPAGGPFLARAVRCPDQDRLYLIDAWLYAPSRDKYEYMIQIQTILDTFRCS